MVIGYHANSKTCQVAALLQSKILQLYSKLFKSLIQLDHERNLCRFSLILEHLVSKIICIENDFLSHPQAIYKLSTIMLYFLFVKHFIVSAFHSVQCQDAIHAFTEFIREEKKKIMILGPGCSKSAEPFAKATPFYNLVQVSANHIRSSKILKFKIIHICNFQFSIGSKTLDQSHYS